MKNNTFSTIDDADTKMERRSTRSHVKSASPSGMPSRVSKSVRSIARHHIESFDYAIGEGLRIAVDQEMEPMNIVLPNSKSFTCWLSAPSFGKPMKEDDPDALDSRIFPAECKQRGMTYTAPLWCVFNYQVDGGRTNSMTYRVGNIPIMVGSSLCHLRDLSPRELTRHREDPHEFGGYFICNGIERCIRMLQVPRRNYIAAIERPSFANRGAKYTSKATMIRCVKRDESGTTVTCHYLNDGNVVVRIMIAKQEFFVPVVVLLRAMKDTTDREIYDRLCCPSVEGGNVHSAFIANHVEVLLRDGTTHGVFSKDEALVLLGSKFRVILNQVGSVDGKSNREIGLMLIRRFVLVHLNDDEDKYTMMLLMLRKLWAFANGDCVADNADALSSQEILLSGHLYLKIMKEQLEGTLLKLRSTLERDARVAELRGYTFSFDPSREASVKKQLAKQGQDAVGKALYYFLATGNLRSESGLDLMQNSGFTIVAEKLNWFRYIAHFRSVHRGRFFTEMKTTTVRKLLPETWGFLCCVHTPDGTPCGLLNHLCAAARVIAKPADPSVAKDVPAMLTKLGMVPMTRGALLLLARGSYMPVLLDGRVVGAVGVADATRVASSLRLLKSAAIRKNQSSADDKEEESKNADDAHAQADAADHDDLYTSMERGVPASMEVALLPGERGGLYPGLYLFTDAGRMVRPVQQRRTGLREWIGPLAQQFMSIECMDQIPTGATHREIDPMNVLSVVASMTPLSDMNQSPRNMYQCQMGKQTMGTPCSNYHFRTDNKMYRLQTPQAPIVQNRAQSKYLMDDHPNGTNAIVAVLAYTGYDMEDAMIINKGSFERGFAHASVYKHKVVDLADKRGVAKERFGLPASSTSETVDAQTRGRRGRDEYRGLGSDGLPFVGQRLRKGDPMYCTMDVTTDEPHVSKYKEKEEAFVDSVTLLGDRNGKQPTKAAIKLRYVRNPIVGDKFASRAGQKGVLSIRWPQQDMPWTESGLQPDVIINPHAFPSRMTIGMLVESMAGKAGAIHGTFQDSTPFRFHEKHRAADYFGEQLRKAGYNYYGSEPMYSGIYGTELQCHIFIGVVYYQRLRHMVSDKSQVRSTGPVNSLTMQPVKGRKRHGGVRFGEMERDSLLAHGTAFLLQDRLMNSSDRHTAHACTECGSILGFEYDTSSFDGATSSHADSDGNEKESKIKYLGDRGLTGRLRCRACKSPSVQGFTMPYVVRYLANELAAMNICLTVDLK